MDIKSRQLIVETTNLCDARCVTCPREVFSQKPHTMNMELYRKIMDDGSQYDINSLDICGFGEPFLDKHLIDRYRYAREVIPNAEIFLSTTGFHMEGDKWDDIIQYVDTIKLSIYGVTKKTYEAVHRGKLKYEDAMANILGFLHYAGKDRPKMIGLYLLTDLNEHEKDAWIQRWEPKLDEVMVWKPHNWITARSYRTVDKSRQKSCGRPENAPCYIHADGTVSPCCFDFNKTIRLGDMTRQTLEEVYTGEEYHNLREAHRNLDFDAYPCRDCDQTNHNPSVLVYASNPDRKVGQLVSNVQNIYREDQDDILRIDGETCVLSST